VELVITGIRAPSNLVQSAVQFLGGGGTVKNVSVIGIDLPLYCLSMIGPSTFNKVTIEQVTCRGSSKGVGVTDAGSLEELTIRHFTFNSPNGFAAIDISGAPTISRFNIESVWVLGGGYGLRVEGTSKVGEIHVDDLTVEDCFLDGIFTESTSNIGLLHVTNSNVFRCDRSGMFLVASGNIILENIFVKVNDGYGIYSANDGAVVLKSSKALSNAASGVLLENIGSVVVDDVLVAGNTANGLEVGSRVLTTAFLTDVVGLDNRDNGLLLNTGVSVNPNVTIANFVACNTGGVGDSLVSIEVSDGLLDVQKEFVAAATPDSCSVQDKSNGIPAACKDSPLIKKFESCAEFCSKKKKKKGGK
jgi:hypothetical protein